MRKLIRILTICAIFLSFTSCDTNNSKVSTTFEMWNKYENIYQFEINVSDKRSPNESMEFEEIIAPKFESTLKNLEEQKQAFVIDCYNFENHDGKEIYILNEELQNAAEEQNDFNVDFSPYGKQITATLSYFKHNAVEIVEDGKIEDYLDADENTLNILVPIQFKVNQEIISTQYQDYFYFQKIDFENMYNEEMGRALDKTHREDLKVNIIYTQENQEYFSFSEDISPENNGIIVDPVIVIYDYKVHSSYAISYLSRCTFLESGLDNLGDAYKDMIPFIKEEVLDYIKIIRVNEKKSSDTP